MKNEYLLTNQIGGFSSSDLVEGNTRKYHGLLIVSDENLNRKVIVGSVEEKVTINGKEYFLNAARYKSGVKSPDGLKYIQKTIIKSNAIAIEYLVEGLKIIKEINLSQENNSITLKYEISNSMPIKLDVSPFVTNRSIHSLKKYSNNAFFKTKKYLNTLDIELSKEEELSIKVLSFNPKSLLNTNYYIDLEQTVYNDFKYIVEEERGLESIEDQIKVGTIEHEFEPGDNYITLQFNYIDILHDQPGKISNTLKPTIEMNDEAVNERNKIKNIRKYLFEKSDDFLIDYNNRKSIVAGYHWFNDWGRDTFISFKGLLLVTKKFDFAKEVLLSWSRQLKNGLIPNELNSKSYNSIDASLWFVVASYYYFVETKDSETILNLSDEFNTIVSEYINGTDFGIHMDDNGYITWDDKKVSLSWMDTSIKGKSATGRFGYLIEIELLWLNVLKILEFFEQKIKLTCLNKNIKNIIKTLHKNINKDFYIEKLGFVYDYIGKDESNDQIRPNVVMGLALPFKVFPKIRAEKILATVRKELLSELGLYTLSPNDSAFVSSYKGSLEERDKAYHNGAIWPFLLGFYLVALYSYKGKAAQTEIKETLVKFFDAMNDKGLKYIPEVFDPTDKNPDGTLSQAWNYALFLEAINVLDK